MSIHRSLVDTQLTCFEPDTVGNMMRGLEYHRFFFDAGTRRLTFLPRCIALNAGRSSREKSVCASVCLSVKCIDRDKTKQKSVQIFYTIRKIIYPSFLRRRMVGVATPSTWNCGSTGHCWSEIADFEPIFARSASAVTPSETSSINTNRKSTTRFPMSLRWTSYVAHKPPKVAQKRKTSVFSVKSHFAWRKSATTFLCVKTVNEKVVTHSLA